jgi:tetratricopeptide (TPR) repeat protein
VAVSNRPTATQELIRRLDGSLPWLGIATVELPAGTEDSLAEVLVRLPADRSGPLMLIGLERSVSSTEGDHPVLRTLNLSRPEWPRRLPRPVVLWVPEYLLPLLAREAPDFLDWRSDTLHFPDLTEGEKVSLDTQPHWGWASGDMTAEQRRARIEELEARLAAPWEATDPVAERARFAWLLEKGDQLQILGEIDQAFQAYQQALALAEERYPPARLESLAPETEQDLARDRAAAFGRIADIFQARGGLDEALRIRQEELPVYERIGDIRGRAITLGKIADILQARGDLEEALRIRREEELPVYERIGSIRERAITLGKIAEILQAQGDFDEALRIQQQEALPVYERIGDIRGRAITLGQIADILQARGDLDEALRIWRNEEIPVYEKAGSAEDLVAAQTIVGRALLARGRHGDLAEARERLTQALSLAEKMKIPQTAKIRALLAEAESGANPSPGDRPAKHP